MSTPSARPAPPAIEPPAPPGEELPWRRWLPWAVKGVVLAMTVGAGVFIFSIKPETWDHLREVDLRYLPVLAALVGLAWLANGVRTWLLAGALGYRLTLRQAVVVSLATEFGNAATPGGVGGLAVRFTWQRRLGIPRAASASMLASDVLVDALFFALLAPFAMAGLVALLPRLHARLPEGTGWGVWVVVAVVLAGVGCWVAWKRPHWLGQVRRGLRDTLRHLGHLGRAGKRALVLSFCAAVVQWGGRYGVLPVTLWALGVPVDPLPLVFVQGAMFFLGLVVALPGGGGTIELLSGIVLPLFAPPAVVGVVVLVWRLFTYHLYVLAGGLALWRGWQAPWMQRPSSLPTAVAEAAGREPTKSPPAP